MRWKKMGFVFNSSVAANGSAAYAMGPVAQHVSGSIFRIHFSGRDAEKRGSLHWVEIDLNNPTCVVDHSSSPSLGLGEKGCFDDNGVFPGSLISIDGQLKCYYAGFDAGASIRFNAGIGRATWDEATRTFTRDYSGPILSASKDYPWFVTAPCVVKDKTGLFHIWFVSCQGWDKENLSIHKYNIEHAISLNGVDWERSHDISINFNDDKEYAIARPCVIYEDGIWRMWFCSRATCGIPTYRIRYAESKDGIRWTRHDEILEGLDVSPSGWDSEMICYPHVFDHAGRRYMLYNGNGYGKTGFGLAVQEKE